MFYYFDKQYDSDYANYVIPSYDTRFTDGQKYMDKPSHTYKDLDDYDNHGYDTYDDGYDSDYSSHVNHSYDMRFTTSQKRRNKQNRTYKDLDDYDNCGYDTYDDDDEYRR